MLKFIHTADIHLGSAMNTRLPAEKSAERRREVRATFGRMADYAAEGAFNGILICGDAFDSDRPLKKDKEYFYNVVKVHPEINFFYLRGNHDVSQSYTEVLPNLKTFSHEWTYYDYGDVVVAGIELYEGNAQSFYSTLRLDHVKTNIVMLHGQIAEGNGEINLARLRGKNIDYLALGHVHSFKSGRLDDRGVFAYCGCPEGRGFDEAGVKGFVELQAGRTVYSRFVPFASRTVNQIVCDVSDCPDWSAAARAAMAACPRSPRDIMQVILKGNVGFDNSTLAADVQKELEPHFYCVSVKDNTHLRTDAASLAADRTLRGAFVRAVLAADGYDAEMRMRIINAGAMALSGRGDEL